MGTSWSRRCSNFARGWQAAAYRLAQSASTSTHQRTPTLSLAQRLASLHPWSEVVFSLRRTRVGTMTRLAGVNLRPIVFLGHSMVCLLAPLGNLEQRGGCTQHMGT